MPQSPNALDVDSGSDSVSDSELEKGLAQAVMTGPKISKEKWRMSAERLGAREVEAYDNKKLEFLMS